MAKESIWRSTAAAILKITDASGDVVGLRHPTFPYVAAWDSDDPADLRRIVAAYLEAARPAFRFAELFIAKGPKPDGTQSDGTDFRDDVPLAWLPLSTGPAALPLESLWISRYDGVDASGVLLDRSAVFFALQSAVPNRVDRVLGSRQGIRIVAHVSAESQPPRTVRITSSSCSPGLRRILGAERAPTPYAPPVKAFFDNVFRSGRLASELKDSLRTAGGVEREVYVNGLRPLGTSEDRALAEVYATVPQQADAHGPALAMTVRISASVDSSGKLDIVVTEVERAPLVSHGTLDCDLFLQAPPCEGGLGGIVGAAPNRSPVELNAFRHHVTLPGLTPSPSDVVLHDDEYGQVEVMQSRLADDHADESQPEHVPLPLDLPHPRMNRFAALSAYQNARGLFDTMRSYGLVPAQFFRHASFPVRIRYRAPMFEGPGRDGRIVNAEVDFDPPLADLIGSVPPTSADLRPLQVRFGLADVKRSDSSRQPLGLATDPRWSWHEYCHVLLAASTGALELPFAHSAGDALAAVLGDSASGLQDVPRFERRWMRGLTFPWVYLDRCHDRSVFEGWSWSGSYHRQSRFPVSGDLPRRKGYLSEQILSTSLFRLYRALGGDTLDDLGQPDRSARFAAASYTAYLVMQAILAIGAHISVPPITPHDFVTALIDADSATLPASSGPLKDRVGGCAHKVITWAFEAQGLDPTVPPSAVVDAPGKPPAVDVFVDTRRRDAEGAFTRGGYMPVSLSFTPEPGPEQRSWLALPSAITVRNRRVTVHVRNRGSVNATGVRVRVRWASWPLGTQPPKWNEAGRWNLLTPRPAQVVRAWPDPGVDFGPFGTLPPAAGRYLILAEASCPADLSNIAKTSLPCATHVTPIIDMVAGDNNLGLIVYQQA